MPSTSRRGATGSPYVSIEIRSSIYSPGIKLQADRAAAVSHGTQSSMVKRRHWPHDETKSEEQSEEKKNLHVEGIRLYHSRGLGRIDDTNEREMRDSRDARCPWEFGATRSDLIEAWSKLWRAFDKFGAP